MRRIVASTALAFTCILIGCGGGGGSRAPLPPASTPVAVPITSASDWPTYAHDYLRSGNQTGETGITPQNVGQLALRWSIKLPDAVYASPVVSGGILVLVTHNTGTVYGISAASGTILWHTTLGGQVRSTPTIADGKVFVGTHLFTLDSGGGYDPAPSAIYALDLTSGSMLWQHNVNGAVRSESVVAGGTVYEGVAGGDAPECIQGGIVALNEETGAAKWTWHVDSVHTQNGGSVWAPLSFDGSHLIFGTGNTCIAPISTANGEVALNLNGSPAWHLMTVNSITDDDVGSGSLLTGGEAIAMSKDGSLYAVSAAAGSLLWSRALGAPDLYGGSATPTSDGSTIMVATATPNAAVSNSSGPNGILYALDMSGGVKWSVTSQAQNLGYAAIDDGIAFASLDNQTVALNLNNGERLWSHQGGALFNASPIVVSSGVYAVDSSGDVYAFALPHS